MEEQEQKAATPDKKPVGSLLSRIFRMVGKCAGVLILAVIGLVILCAGLLYVPAVQDKVKEIALEKVKESSGMDIRAGRLRLLFPLRVAIDDVTVIEATGDTMVTARSAALKVSPAGLLRLNVDVSAVTLTDAYYQLGTPDSAMWLRARIDRFDLDATDLGLRSGTIDIGRGSVDGARVVLVMRDTVTATPSDTTASTPWVITARQLELHNVDYIMTMPPTIDSLGCHVATALLTRAHIDMGSRTISAGALEAQIGSATYLTPPAPATAATAQADATAATSEKWTVTADLLQFTADSALYAVRGAAPLPGLDMNYLQVKGVTIAVDSFYNCGTDITVPLRRIEATERCGIRLSGSGLFTIADSLMQARGFSIRTDYSSAQLEAAMGVGDLTADPSLPLRLRLEGQLGLDDAELAMPSLHQMLAGIPRSPARLAARVSGTAGHLTVEELRASIERFVTAEASGSVSSPFDPERIKGDIDLRVEAAGLNSIKPTVMEARLAKEINLPYMTLAGRVSYSPGLTVGRLGLRSGGGSIGFDGRWEERREGYKADLDVREFPVARFMPSLGVGNVTATLSAEGHGFDFFKTGTEADLQADVTSVEYMERTYRDIVLEAQLTGGEARGSLSSLNPDADLSADFHAALSDTLMTWTLDGNIRNLDPGAMRLTESAMQGSMTLSSEGSASPDFKNIDGHLTVKDLRWAMPDMAIATPEIGLSILTSDTTVNARLLNGDLSARVAAGCGLDTLMARLADASVRFDSAIVHRNADIALLQSSLPPLALIAEMGGMNNIAGSILRDREMSLSNATLSLTNDSLISMSAQVMRLVTGSTRLDTVALGVVQHGKYLAYKASVNNRRGTMDGFAHVALSGFLGEDRVTALLRQTNIEGEQGFMFGLSAVAADSTVTVRFVPYTPTIGYKKWELNRDNFVTYNFINRHLDADLKMSNDKSLIKLFTEHVEHSDSTGREQEDVVLQLSDIHLADWLSVSPFAPQIKGDLGADMRFRWNTSELTGRGVLTLNDLIYGRDRVGSFKVGLDVTNAANGALYADASLLVDSIKVITARGHLNDSTALHPFDLDFSMIRFPLRILNPFLPKEYAQMTGVLNGTMDITGSMTEPQFNGYLTFDSTSVKVGMIGSSFRFSDTRIPVDSNVVRFDGFTITAANKNPLTVNGTVDARKLTDIGIDLTMKAREMQIMNTNRARGGADAFGKAFINADIGVKGNMTMLDVDATLNLLNGTNVTYIMDDAGSELTNQSTGDMVRFVNFSDSVQVMQADTIAPPSMMMNMMATLIVSQGTTLNVYLDTDGSNRVSVQGQGELTYTMSPQNSGRLTGRFNINGGNVRYSIPPVLSEKNFVFNEGSYVAFTGDMMNPQLNISATDHIKANVVQSGQNSRLVDFNVTLNVGGTLSAMDLAFDMSTDNDITVQNELASMSPQQRASEAMNLLLTNVYSGPETRGSANLSGNPLLSFLTGQLNSWAAKTIKGVDLSFGMNQYDTTTNGTTGTTTSYSYRVSKSLFNDRFKIVVGGNYSTDDNVDENFSQNLISDISFEYVINKSGSMYVRLFRHTGYESILEGEVTQTGAGFVYKKKVGSIKDVFRFMRHIRKLFPQKDQPAPALPAPAIPEHEGEARSVQL